MHRTYSYEGRCYNLEYEGKILWNFYLSCDEKDWDRVITSMRQELDAAVIVRIRLTGLNDLAFPGEQSAPVQDCTVVVEDRHIETFKTMLHKYSFKYV